jgi:hypothetical protein
VRAPGETLIDARLTHAYLLAATTTACPGHHHGEPASLAVALAVSQSVRGTRVPTNSLACARNTLWLSSTTRAARALVGRVLDEQNERKYAHEPTQLDADDCKVAKGMAMT